MKWVPVFGYKAKFVNVSNIAELEVTLSGEQDGRHIVQASLNNGNKRTLFSGPEKECDQYIFKLMDVSGSRPDIMITK